MDVSDLLLDAFGRVRDTAHGAVGGIDPAHLVARLDDDANTIAWLVWHLTRIQDDHVADVAGLEQVWTSAGWAERFGLPFDEAAVGYGQSSEEVGAVQITDPGLLRGYHDAVHAETVRYVQGLDAGALDRVVDDRWDPPVTLGVRLVSVVNDGLQHAGQAAYARGVLERQRAADG